MEDTQSVDKKVISPRMQSYYNRIGELKEAVGKHANKHIPDLYNVLILEKYSPKSAREKITKDCENIWTERTIRDNLPKETKSETHVMGAETRNEKKKLIVANTGETMNEPSVLHDNAKTTNPVGIFPQAKTHKQPESTPASGYADIDRALGRKLAERLDVLVKARLIVVDGVVKEVTDYRE